MQNYANDMDTRISQNCVCLTQIQQSRVCNSLEEYSPLLFQVKHQILFWHKTFGSLLRVFSLQARLVPSYQTKLKLGSCWVPLSCAKRRIPMNRVGATNISNIIWLFNSSLLSEWLKFSLSGSWDQWNTFKLTTCNRTPDVAFKSHQKKF